MPNRTERREREREREEEEGEERGGERGEGREYEMAWRRDTKQNRQSRFTIIIGCLKRLSRKRNCVNKRNMPKENDRAAADADDRTNQT